MQREKVAAVREEAAKQMERLRTQVRERIDAILTPEKRRARPAPR